MGLIKAFVSSVGGTFADQWKEYFYCDSLDSNTLAVKGQKKTSGRSTNRKGSDNIISNGSGIVVNEGQCMMIVEGGKVVEFTAESGEFTYDSSSEPSIFTGSFGKSLLDTFKTMGKRFTYGGAESRDQRVYYFNTKEILDNKFGTANPIPFRIVDKKLDLDLDAEIKCFGLYSYKISDPMVFYTNLCGNMTSSYTRSNLDNQLKSEFLSALQPAFGKLSQLGLRPNEIVSHTAEMEDALNSILSEKWQKNRGLSIASVSISSLTLDDEYQKLISNAQKTHMLSSSRMAAGTLVEAQAEAMKAAASNPNSAITGFMGLGLAQTAGGFDLNTLLKTANAQENIANENSWTCPKCGNNNTSSFCSNCGTQKPSAKATWVCSCGSSNSGNFCTSCGTKRPERVKYKCSNCGFVPSDPTAPPRFCPSCGDKFGEEDIDN